MFDNRPLDEIVQSMRNVGEMLIPQNYPKMLSSSREDDLLIFKKKNLVVDGYNIDIHYQKSDFDDYFTETLQIYAQYCPFLPFNIVVKLAKKFLGENHLSLVEIYREGRKIYIWMLHVDRTGNPIELPFDIPVESCDFEGMKYSYMSPVHVHIF
jgi:hypothetical protein